MRYARLPQDTPRQPLPFYLAMEEWLARNFTEDFFFCWQVSPTVIFGRNQEAGAELDMDYCRREGIAFYRRKSGGGCVYADDNNIMFSHVTSSREVATTFGEYTGRVAEMLRALGIAEAHTTGRNDILIGERKVSGYAFYNINRRGENGESLTRAIVHGTMLYDADLERMARALTPSAGKLSSKGVKSVRSRVTTIKEHNPIGIEAFKRFACGQLCDGEMQLTCDDVAEIRRIAEPYYTDEWIYGTGHRHGAPAGRRVRIEGVGEFMVDMTLSSETPPRITGLDLKGDFFLISDLDPLLEHLEGTPLTPCDIELRLADMPPGEIIKGADAPAFARMLASAGHMSL